MYIAHLILPFMKSLLNSHTHFKKNKTGSSFYCEVLYTSWMQVLFIPFLSQSRFHSLGKTSSCCHYLIFFSKTLQILPGWLVALIRVKDQHVRIPGACGKERSVLFEDMVRDFCLTSSLMPWCWLSASQKGKQDWKPEWTFKEKGYIRDVSEPVFVTSPKVDPFLIHSPLQLPRWETKHRWETNDLDTIIYKLPLKISQFLKLSL
jgi:hypothetical protein